MARLFTIGFEAQLLSTAAGQAVEPGVIRSGGVEIDTAVPRSGLACAKAVSGSTNYAQLTLTPTLPRTYYYRVPFRISALPGSTAAICRLHDSTGTLLELTVSPAGKLEMWNAVAAAHLAGEAAPTIEPNRWYVAAILCKVPTEGKGKVSWRLDGTTIAAEQEMSLRNSGVTVLRAGNINGGAFNVFTDDWAVNDDQGETENSWPGNTRKVVMAKPVADKARTGWTGGGGGTANLFEALNNTPPQGAALGSAADATQIKDGNNNSTDAVEVRMGAYNASLAAGGCGLIPPDEVKLVTVLVRGGQDSATSRTIGVTVVSNPAIAEKTGSTNSEAAAAETAGWRTVPGITSAAIVYNPAIAQGEGAVVKIRKGTTTTDALMVDMLGLLVEYEPGTEFTDTAAGTAAASGSGEDTLEGADTGSAAAAAAGSGEELAAADDIGSGAAVAGGSATSETAGDGPTYRSVVLDDDPLLYWRLNESGNTEVEDRSGNGRVGEYRNEAGLGAPGALEGDPDASVVLEEAKAGYVKGLTYDPFSGTKTFEIWAKRKAAHEKEDVFFGGSNGGGAGVYAYIKEGTDNIRLTINGFGTTATWEHAWPGDGSWAHIVFVINTSTLKATLYVNGVNKGEKAISVYGGTAGNVRISHDNGTGGIKGAWSGWLDEFAIYEGALPAERVLAHYEAGTRAPAPPAAGCLFGADMDGDVALLEGEAKARGDAPYDATTWDRFETHAGKAVNLVHFADPWRSPAEGGLQWDGYGSGASEAVRARGAIPLKSIGQTATVIPEVLAGEHDASIDQWALQAAAYGDLVMIRPWWEMNGGWFTKATGPEFVAAWRYLHTRIASIADNVLFVWCPNVIAGGIADPEPWYPGDDYVNWTGMDGYSGQHPVKTYGWRTAHKLFRATYDRLLEFAPGKPIMICETAASEFGGSKSTWIANLLGEALQEDMPRIKGLVWFNWNIVSNAKGERIDWPIESSPAAQAAFKTGISSPYYGNALRVELAIAAASSPSKAALKGTVEPAGLPTTYWFEYGETAGYGSKTPVLELGPLGEPQPVDALLKDLRPNSAYHARLVAENELGQVSTADLEFTTPRALAARVLAQPVDDTLFVEPRSVDGGRSRWSGAERDAGNIAQGTKTSSSAPGGHRDASFSLTRDPRFDWPDLNLGDDVVIRGRTQPLGRNAFEGMMQQFPAQLGDGFSIGVEAVGHQDLLNEDENFRALYVKLGFAGWGEAPLARRLRNAELGRSQGKIPLASSEEGLTWDPPVGPLAANEVTEAHFAAPAGLPISKLGYRGIRKGDWSPFEPSAVAGDDTEDFKEGAEERTLTLDGTARMAAFARSWRYLRLRALVTKELSAGAGMQQSFDRLAVYGETGVPLQDIPGEPPGVYFHDALAHILATGAPDLQFTVRGDGTIVPNTTLVMPDFAPTDPAPPKEAIEKGNAYFLNNWAVWDKKTFYWHPWDPDRLTWIANIAGGAQWAPVGRQASTLLNGIVLSYTDAAGVSRLAGPPGSGCDYEDPALADPDPANPYTCQGRRRWGRLDVGFPLAYPSTAIQVGAIVLAESRMPQRAGTLVVKPRGPGHVPSIGHPTMGPVPLWAVRAGDFGQLPDWPDPEPFRIIETEYDDDSKTLTAQLDSGAARLGAILERTGSRLTLG
jgi:hypothetical protein